MVIKYGNLTPEILEKIRAIVGDDNIYDSSEDLEKHAIDESPLEPHLPQVVVKPTSTEQVSQVVKLANEFKIPVTPQGSLTG